MYFRLKPGRYTKWRGFRLQPEGCRRRESLHAAFRLKPEATQAGLLLPRRQTDDEGIWLKRFSFTGSPVHQFTGFVGSPAIVPP